MSSLPIYQASFLLASKTSTIQITKMIRDFLWHGGKGNQKKYHLVNWETVKRPYAEGGLQVRDPKLENIALGGKIIRNLYANHRHPIRNLLKKISLWRLYEKPPGNEHPQRNLDLENNEEGGM
jgi:hypothetical protein